MATRDRIKRYKTIGSGAGLVRVEVLVSAEDRGAILERAAELRAMRRKANSDQPVGRPAPNQEMVNDRAKLILHRFVARSIRKDATPLEAARKKLATIEGFVPDYIEAWRKILDQPAHDVARQIIQRSDTMVRLRTASPFSAPPGLDDPDTRRRLWRKAKLGLPG
jgi:hypothetical protein